jgi:tripartite-type tricarboxylate transporter receptor subunit TctC
MRKRLYVTVCSLLSFCFVASAFAADWPRKPVTLVVPFSAGGNTDVLIRVIGKHMAEKLKTTVVVKNSSGGAGTLGSAEVAKARPDGYTVLASSSSPVVLQPLMRELPYNNDSWEYVCRALSQPECLMVSTNSEFKNFQDLIDKVKKSPDKYVYATPGPGSLGHISFLKLINLYNLKMRHVPEKGSAEAMKALAGGTSHMFIDPATPIGRFDVKGLLFFSPERVKVHPDVPSIAEFVKEPIDYSVWILFLAPKGTPKPIVSTLAEAVQYALTQPDVLKTAADAASFPAYLPTEQFKAIFAAESAKYKKVIDAEPGLRQ